MAKKTDRTEIGSNGTKLVATRVEGRKNARDSLVMTRNGETIRVGRVSAFLSHSAQAIHALGKA